MQKNRLPFFYLRNLIFYIYPKAKNHLTKYTGYLNSSITFFKSSLHNDFNDL